MARPNQLRLVQIKSLVVKEKLRRSSVEMEVVELSGEVKVKLFWSAAKESRPGRSLRVPARLSQLPTPQPFVMLHWQRALD